jgi:carboxypeptidase C (cathepsin A)
MEIPDMTRSLVAFLMSLALSMAGVATADQHEKPKKPMGDVPEPKVFVTSHTGNFGGQSISYTVTAGETYLLDDEGEPKASIFSIAYVKDGVEDPTTRPVTFLWNGGPGSSSVWLHMGAFGPKRVVVPSEAEDDGAPPFRMEDNPLAPLDVTDIVFVDPVGTGFSRPLGEHEGEEFWGVHEDGQAVAEFIRTWISDNKRWASPKFIGGESYGTTRSAAVVRELEGGFDDVSLNGLILISTVMDFYTSSFATGNELGYITNLPTMAATAAYHGKVDPAPADLEAFLAEVREFAITDYATALLRGNTLPDDRTTPASTRTTSTFPTCASPTGASTRSSYATRAWWSGASTVVTPAATSTTPARRPRPTPPSTVSTAPTPQRSITT